MEWTFQEKKAFENAVAELGLGCPNLFGEIAQRIPRKNIEQIEMYHNELVRDVDMIETRGFDEQAMKCYADLASRNQDGSSITSDSKDPPVSNAPNHVRRRRGIPWTDEEHEAFLAGLKRYGRGDWKSISRYCLFTKTPRQIASHAQKYFQKLRKYAH